MKKESTFGYVLRLALTLLMITGVVAALLAGINTITAPRIAAANAEKTLSALSQVLPDAQTAKALDSFPDDSGIVQAVYQSDSGYAIQVAPAGFGGEISMMVGVDAEGKVLGISIISHTETVGLGAVAAASSAKGQAFRDQFVGLSGTLAVTKDGGTIDALSSATITSRAVTEGVNTALAWVAQNG